MKIKNILIGGTLFITFCAFIVFIGNKIVRPLMNGVSAGTEQIVLDDRIAGVIQNSSYFEVENNNLAQGGLISFSENKIYYSDITKGGVLCVSNIGEEANSYILTDFPVANISVRDDRILFTDISGTFYTGLDQEGNEVVRKPDEVYTMGMYLAGQGLTEKINWGGNVYCAGIGAYDGDASEITLEGTEVSSDGMYYSPRLTKDHSVMALAIPNEVYVSFAYSNVYLASTGQSMPGFGEDNGKSFIQYIKDSIAENRDTVLILRPGQEPGGNEWIREIPNYERKDGEVPVTDGKIQLFGDGFFALEMTNFDSKTEESVNRIVFYNLNDKNEENHYKQLSSIEGGKNLIVKDGQLFYLNQQGDIMRHDPEKGTEYLLKGQNIQNMFLNGNGDFQLTLPVFDEQGKERMLPAVMKEGTWVEKLFTSDLEGERGIYYITPGNEKENPYFVNPFEGGPDTYTLIADFNLVKKLVGENISYYRDANPLSDVYYRIKKWNQKASEANSYGGIGFVIEKNENYDPEASDGDNILTAVKEEDRIALSEEINEEKKEEKNDKNKGQEKGQNAEDIQTGNKSKTDGNNPYFPAIPYTASDSYYFYPREGEENTFVAGVCSPYVHPSKWAGWFVMGAEMDNVFEEKDTEGYYIVENYSSLMQWDADGKNCKIIRKLSFIHDYAADNMQKALENGVSGITYRTPAKKKQQLEDSEYIRTGNIIYYCYEASSYDKPWDQAGIARMSFSMDMTGLYPAVEDSLKIYNTYAPNTQKEEVLAYGVFGDRELYELFESEASTFTWYYSDSPGEISDSDMQEDMDTVYESEAPQTEDTKDAENAEAAEDIYNSAEPESHNQWQPFKRIIFKGMQYPGPEKTNEALEQDGDKAERENKNKEENLDTADNRKPSDSKTHTEPRAGKDKVTQDPDGEIDGDDYDWNLTFEDLDPGISGLETNKYMFKDSIESITNGTPYSEEQIEAYWANKARGTIVSDKFTDEEMQLLAGLAVSINWKDETGDFSDLISADDLSKVLTSYYYYVDKMKPNDIQFKFLEDGTCTYTADIYEGSYTGTYTVEGNVLCIDRDDQDYDSEYYIYVLPYHSTGGPYADTQNTLWLQNKDLPAIMEQFHGVK